MEEMSNACFIIPGYLFLEIHILNKIQVLEICRIYLSKRSHTEKSANSSCRFDGVLPISTEKGGRKYLHEVPLSLKKSEYLLPTFRVDLKCIPRQNSNTVFSLLVSIEKY
jgi:hypothetical protein